MNAPPLIKIQNYLNRQFYVNMQRFKNTARTILMLFSTLFLH